MLAENQRRRVEPPDPAWGITPCPLGRRKPNAQRLTWAGMKSYEIIREAVQEPGVKAVAAQLKLSAALVYKWCEPTPEDDVGEQSGAKNPLDRVRDLYNITRDIRLIRWLCNEAGGFFVTNPAIEPGRTAEQSIWQQSRKMVRDFSELLDAVNESVDDDHSVDRDEADEIRQKWEDLKMLVEQFVVGCERGLYHLKHK